MYSLIEVKTLKIILKKYVNKRVSLYFIYRLLNYST